jgi:hypothetical protein
MSWTKLILAVYPALLIASLYLTGKGMADQLDLTPRPGEVLWMAVWSIGIPTVHLFAFRRIRFDPIAYRTTAGVAAPFILLPFIGLVVGASVYLLLSYLLFTRGRQHVRADERA